MSISNSGKYQVKGCLHSYNRQGIQLYMDSDSFKTESRETEEYQQGENRNTVTKKISC